MSKHHILVVEDDAEMAEHVIDALSEFGYETTWVQSSSCALQALGEASFCLVLLDLGIKRTRESMSSSVSYGHLLLRKIRDTILPGRNSDDCHVHPILILSSHADPLNMERAYDRHRVDGFIPKANLSTLELVERIERQLAASGRKEHSSCEKIMREQPGSTVGIVLTGETCPKMPKRTRMEFAGRTASLTLSSCRTLLRLARYRYHHGRNVYMPGSELENGNVHKVVSRLRIDAGDPSIVENDQSGGYRLGSEVGDVVVRGTPDQWTKWSAMVKDLAQEVQKLADVRLTSD